MVQRGLLDLDMVRRLMKSAKGSLEASKVKKNARGTGYTFAMSLYGVLQHKETGKARYIRIEILAKAPLEERDIELIYRWFQQIHPVMTYSIWLYDHKDETLEKVFNTW